MASLRVTEALSGVRRLTRGRARIVSVGRVPGAELVRIGGGDLLPTPLVPELPCREDDRERGLCGETLALPAANVRLLRDVRICVGENLIRTDDGSVVVDNTSSQRVGRPARQAPESLVLQHGGTAALYGAPDSGQFEALVDDIAPIVLLQHAVLRRVSPITVMHTPGGSMLATFMLKAAMNSQVRCEAVPAGSVVEADLTAFPSPVTREGAGAIPRWFRRWVDLRANSAGAQPAARKLVLTHGSSDPLMLQPELMTPALEAGFAHIDTLSGQLDGDGTLDAEQLVSTLAHATAVVGASDDALASSILCRRAEVVQLGVGPTISPRVAQLAASKALPYRFVSSGGLAGILESI